MRWLPIIERDSNGLVPNAGLILIGHMLYPENPVSVQQYIRMPLDEAQFGSEVHDGESVESSYKDFLYSAQFEQLLTRRKKLFTNGSKVGRVFRKKIQLLKHWGHGSDLLAIWIVANELIRDGESGAIQNSAHNGLKATYSRFQDVAHLWAALDFLNSEEVNSLHGAGKNWDTKILYHFLSVSHWFQESVKISDLERPYNSNLERWLVPDVFGAASTSLPVPELSKNDILCIDCYRANSL